MIKSLILMGGIAGIIALSIWAAIELVQRARKANRTNRIEEAQVLRIQAETEVATEQAELARQARINEQLNVR